MKNLIIVTAIVLLLAYLVVGSVLQLPVSGVEIERSTFPTAILVDTVDINEDGEPESIFETYKGANLIVIACYTFDSDKAYWMGFDLKADDTINFTIYDKDMDGQLDFETYETLREPLLWSQQISGEDLRDLINQLIKENFTLNGKFI